MKPHLMLLLWYNIVVRSMSLTGPFCFLFIFFQTGQLQIWRISKITSSCMQESILPIAHLYTKCILCLQLLITITTTTTSLHVAVMDVSI